MIQVTLQDSFGFRESVTSRVTPRMSVLEAHQQQTSVPIFATGDSLGFLTAQFWAGGI